MLPGPRSQLPRSLALSQAMNSQGSGAPRFRVRSPAYAPDVACNMCLFSALLFSLLDNLSSCFDSLPSTHYPYNAISSVSHFAIAIVVTSSYPSMKLLKTTLIRDRHSLAQNDAVSIFAYNHQIWLHGRGITS